MSGRLMRIKYPNIIQPPFKQGDWVSKKNFTVFGGHRENGMPAIKVKQAFYNEQKKLWFINKFYQIEFFEALEIIDEVKANSLNYIHSSLKISEPIALTEEEVCKTFHTGTLQYKERFKNEKRVLNVLYTFQMRKPEEQYKAYKCPYCNFYHIGRIKIVENGIL